MTEDRAWRKDLPKSVDVNAKGKEQPMPPEVNSIVTKNWKNRKYENPQSAAEVTGADSEQFEWLKDNHPAFKGFHVLNNLRNELIFSRNTLIHQGASIAGMALDGVSHHVLEGFETILTGHMHGAVPQVKAALNSAHELHKSLLEEPAIQGNKAFLESPSGIHLQSLVHNIFPKTIKDYNETTEE
jgi:hypothetical protein